MASVAPVLAAGAGQAWTGPAAGEQPGGGQWYGIPDESVMKTIGVPPTIWLMDLA